MGRCRFLYRKRRGESRTFPGDRDRTRTLLARVMTILISADQGAVRAAVPFAKARPVKSVFLCPVMLNAKGRNSGAHLACDIPGKIHCSGLEHPSAKSVTRPSRIKYLLDRDGRYQQPVACNIDKRPFRSPCGNYRLHRFMEVLHFPVSHLEKQRELI